MDKQLLASLSEFELGNRLDLEWNKPFGPRHYSILLYNSHLLY